MKTNKIIKQIGKKRNKSFTLELSLMILCLIFAVIAVQTNILFISFLSGLCFAYSAFASWYRTLKEEQLRILLSNAK